MIPKNVTMKSCVGKRAVADCDISNHYGTIAKGSEVEITGSNSYGMEICTPPCKYCGEEPEPIINTDDLTVHVDALLGKLYANHYNGQMWECERVDIDYCPMCGRDLRGGEQ